MNILSIIFVASIIQFFALTAAQARGNSPSKNPVSVAPTASRNAITCEIDKKLIGGHIEVLTLSGECIACLPVAKRKFTIYLGDALPGQYVVRVVKNGMTENIQFATK